jgi:hypothetical protein
MDGSSFVDRLISARSLKSGVKARGLPSRLVTSKGRVEAVKKYGGVDTSVSRPPAPMFTGQETLDLFQNSKWKSSYRLAQGNLHKLIMHGWFPSYSACHNYPICPRSTCQRHRPAHWRHLSLAISCKILPCTGATWHDT